MQKRSYILSLLLLSNVFCSLSSPAAFAGQAAAAGTAKALKKQAPKARDSDEQQKFDKLYFSPSNNTGGSEPVTSKAGAEINEADKSGSDKSGSDNSGSVKQETDKVGTGAASSAVAGDSESLPAPSPTPEAPAPIVRMSQPATDASAAYAPNLSPGDKDISDGDAMPPVAPSMGGQAQSERKVFNLQAQQIDLRLQRQSPNMMPGDPRFGQGNPQFNQGIGAGQLNAGARQLGARAGQDQNEAKRSLTQVELQKLAAHDVVLVIDRSASMAAMDCPRGNGPIANSGLGLLPALLGIPISTTSRWSWCAQQTSELAQETEGVFKQGITVVLFSTGFFVFPNVSIKSVPEIFNRNFPAGGTNLAPALASQIGEYFQRRAYMRGNVKPLMIGIITDGCPTSRQAVRNAIIDATHLMRSADEITIIFFMVGGMDFMGTAFVNELSTNLVAEGARYPIVRQVSFQELQKVGLAKAIAINLQ